MKATDISQACDSLLEADPLDAFLAKAPTAVASLVRQSPKARQALTQLNPMDLETLAQGKPVQGGSPEVDKIISWVISKIGFYQHQGDKK